MPNTSLRLVSQLATLNFLFSLAGNGFMLSHVPLISQGCVNSSVGISSQEFTKSLLLVSVGSYVESCAFYLRDLVQPFP